MIGKPRPVRSFEDAVTWLSFMGRFLEGDPGKHARGCCRVLVDIEEELEATRERCTALAKRLEALEAAQQGEGL